MVGGRDRERAGDPLPTKHETRFHSLYPSLVPTFPTNRGTCISLKANSNVLKTMDSCTVGAQRKSPRLNPLLRQRWASDWASERDFCSNVMPLSAKERHHRRWQGSPRPH